MQKRARDSREIGNPVTFNVSRHGIPAYAETTNKWLYKFSITRNTTLNRLQNIQRTRHTFTTLVQHMGVNHRRRHIFVAKQFLNGANVIAALQQMPRERMATYAALWLWLSSPHAPRA